MVRKLPPMLPFTPASLPSRPRIRRGRRVILPALGSLAAAVAVSAAPNVLLVIADDFGIDAAALYAEPGDPVSRAPMPHLAALAEAGLTFTQAYACPVCSPTRAALLTGRHGFRTGVGAPVSPAAGNALAETEFTLPRAFAAAGSAHALKHFGKWHLSAGLNINRTPATTGGWPAYSGSLGGAVSDYHAWTKVETDGTLAGTTSQTVTTYATTDVVDDATAWIAQQRAAGTPWFAWVAFNAPHTPYHLPPEHLRPSYADLTGSATDLQNRPQLYYDAALEALDSELGRLLAAVDPTVTTVIFLGDNGTPRRVVRAPFRAGTGKDTLYDAGVRVPFVVRGPTVAEPGRIVADLVHVADLYPTLLELAGVRPAAVIPPGVTTDGQSFAGVLGGQAGARRHLYVDAFNASDPVAGGRMIRDEAYKLIVYNMGYEELFHLPSDPAEANDLLAAPLSAEAQRHYDRLRWWLAGYSEVAAPELGAVGSSEAGVSVAVMLQSGATAELWRCEDLAGAFWAPVPDPASLADGDRITLIDPSPPTTHGFYGLLVRQP